MIGPNEEDSFKHLLNDMKINGSSIEADTVPVLLPVVDKGSTVETGEECTSSDVPTTIPSKSAEKVAHTRRSKAIRVIKRPTRMTKSEVTLDDPVSSLENPSMANLGYNWAEKCLTKFDLLTNTRRNEAVASSSSGVTDLPRLADRLGIYFDPQLFNYYRGLLRSLPPIRIFLHIEEDDDSETDLEEEFMMSAMKRPRIVYPSKANRIQKQNVQRKTFSDSRLPVKTMCSVNGKVRIHFLNEK